MSNGDVRIDELESIDAPGVGEFASGCTVGVGLVAVGVGTAAVVT
ncbi:hypothetical protein [Actinomyces sp. 2119]|nr:hypothetical protein [Actinomyces sp. 2119]